MVKDVVCGMEVSENAAGYSLIFEDRKYFFLLAGLPGGI